MPNLADALTPHQQRPAIGHLASSNMKIREIRHTYGNTDCYLAQLIDSVDIIVELDNGEVMMANYITHERGTPVSTAELKWNKESAWRMLGRMLVTHLQQELEAAKEEVSHAD